MKICVLSSPDGWHLLDLQRAAKGEHLIENGSFESLADTVGCWNGADCNAHWLEKYDCLITRAMPYGSLQQVVFRMDVLLELEQRGLRIVNPPRTIEMSVDKYLALTRLDRDGLPVPPTAVSQNFEFALEQFERLGGDVVIKPLFGSLGRGLERITTLKLARKRFRDLIAAESVIYQQRFIDHGGFDLRILVIGDDVMGMKRVNDQHWITNIAQGATGHPHPVTSDEKELAIAAARSVGAEFAGIDIVYDLSSGRPYVLEVNSAPSWQTISTVLQIDVAKRFLDFLEESATNSGN